MTKPHAVPPSDPVGGQRLKKYAALALVLVVVGAGGCSCQTIREGNFGLKQSTLTAAYDHQPLGSGLQFAFLSSIHEYFGREEIIQIGDIHPKDKSNILLKELDLVVTFQVDRHKAADFLVRTNDAVEKDGTVLLGTQRVDRSARQVIGPSVRHFESIEILNDPSKLQDQFKADLQAHLDSEYGPGVLRIVDVKVANILVSDVIETRIQSVAVLAAERARNEATMAILESRQKTLSQEALVIKNAAMAGGLTVDQLLQAELIKALREGVKAEVMVPAK
jgi:hypothetical protein